LATSSTVKRTWGPGLHHVIDPATGRPAVTDARQVTTWAPTGAEAEVAATAMLLRGTRSVADAPSVIVGVDGTVHVSMKHQRRMAA
jgi:thiamine biosynthesis lipoprotein